MAPLFAPRVSSTAVRMTRAVLRQPRVTRNKNGSSFQSRRREMNLPGLVAEKPAIARLIPPRGRPGSTYLSCGLRVDEIALRSV
jgi:hypothetical protein